MSLVTGLALGLMVMVLGAGGLTCFALYLRKREEPVVPKSKHANPA